MSTVAQATGPSSDSAWAADGARTARARTRDGRWKRIGNSSASAREGWSLLIWRHAHRHLERELAQGAPREGAVVARAGQAGRVADAGDQARRQRRADGALPRRGLRARASRRRGLE